MAALAEMYVQGVSTRKVKAVTEELCGHSFSASSISAMNSEAGRELAPQFAGRPLAEAFPYLILDARYERVREAGVIVGEAGTDRDRDRIGRPPPGVGSRARQPRESVELAGFLSWAEDARPPRRRIRGEPTIMPACRQAARRFCPEAASSAAMCIFCATRSTTCRAGRRRLSAGAALAV